MVQSDRPILGLRYILIAGCSELGAAVATELANQGNKVHVLDEKPSSFDRIPSEIREAQRIETTIGDGAAPDDLMKARIQEVDVFMSLTNRDTTNILSAQIAKRGYNVDIVVCRVDNPDLQTMCQEMGLTAIGATSLLIDHAVRAASA